MQHKDIDECSVLNGNCHHICSNEEGTFTCSCHPGYELLNDNRTCQGLIIFSECHDYYYSSLPEGQ